MIKHPFLLTMPSYGGSLAAVRCLGTHGIGVTVACSEFLAAARWSRHATRRVRCPSAEDPERFLDWLLEFGEREPRHVLYAPSDSIAFLIAVNAAELGKRFLLYQPAVESLVQIQDKKRLEEACATLDLETVPTWYPEDEADLRRMASELPYPVLIKARTQVFRIHQTKGVVVNRQSDLMAAYRAFVAKDDYRPGLEPHFGVVDKPMIQGFFSKGAESVWSVTGFIDRTGTLMAARAARKVLQRTHPVGLGLCFEAAPLEASLLDAAARLCRLVGYFGIFEIEFVREGGRDRVIDFNPRFYGQMGFDHARGLPLAYLAWLGAVGDSTGLHADLGQAAAGGDSGAEVFTHRFVFELLLLAKRLGGSISSAECARWRKWLADHRERSVDASADQADRWPGFVQAASELTLGLRSIRRVFRQRPHASAHIQSVAGMGTIGDRPIL